MSSDPRFPKHYDVDLQPIDFIQAHRLGFNLGNVVKYVTRSRYRDTEERTADLLKAMFYIQFELHQIGAWRDPREEPCPVQE